jgi:hypothetical protein
MKTYSINEQVALAFQKKFPRQASKLLETYMTNVLELQQNPTINKIELEKEIDELNLQIQKNQELINIKKKQIKQIQEKNQCEDSEIEAQKEYNLSMEDINFQDKFRRAYIKSEERVQGKTELEYYITVYKPMLATLTETKKQTE